MTGAALPPIKSYKASPIKRGRATKTQVEERRSALLDIVADMQPMTVRQVFYQASVRGIIEKRKPATERCKMILC